jgi:hypothetical protein
MSSKKMTEEKVRRERERIREEWEVRNLPIPRGYEYIKDGIELGVPERR